MEHLELTLATISYTGTIGVIFTCYAITLCHKLHVYVYFKNSKKMKLNLSEREEREL